METPSLDRSFSFQDMLRFLPPAVDYSGMSNEELLAELKKTSDYEKLVFPNSWYSKFDLPVKTAADTREFLKESPWTKTSRHYYIEKIDVPAQPGGLRPTLPAPEVPIVTVIQNSFSDATPIDQTVSSDPPETQQS